GSYRMMRL
nr:myomodulin B [Aplysia sp.]